MRSAVKELRGLPAKEVLRIGNAVETLRENPFPATSKKLLGSENSHRIQVGNYRVIYDILDTLLIVEVQAVGHRKDIYRK